MTDRRAGRRAGHSVRTVMQVRVLGTLEVVADDEPVTLASPKLRRLLAALVVEEGAVVSADRLADIVWGDAPPSNVTGALHNQISRLRSRLRSGPDRDGIELLTRAPGYALDLADDALDANRFERLVARARERLADDAARAAALLDDAVELWRGDAYAEFRDESFARFEAARLEELRAAAHEERVEAALAQGATDDAIARLELLTGAQPLRERPHAQLMVALYRVGRQADALAVYRRYRRRLGDELGLEPSADLQELEGRVLRGDAGLAPPVVPPAGRPPVWTTPSTSLTYATADDQAPEDAATQRGNLPPPPRLIGRDALVTTTVEALRDARVVTLTGPGGVGKTSMAMRVATQVAPDQRDGGWWHELASVDTPDAVAQMVMTVLQAQLRPGMDPVAGVVDYLRHQRMLLVLDNAEHVIDGVADLVGAVAQECPAVRVLVTSRERIGVAGEQVVGVPPLPLPARGALTDLDQALEVPAIALFARRAAATGTFELTDANVDIVFEICRRLDGVPLALELAATRMRSMSPADLLDRLTWRFRVLRGGRRGAEPRHRTLRAVVDWSYDLLSERAQLVFERLSVFAADFTLDAAEQVVATTNDDLDPLDVAEVIAELVDTSMVSASTSTGAGRYFMLETIREYGRERLAAGSDRAAARRAHARYYTELAETVADGLYDLDNPDRVVLLDQSIDELRAAHAWSCAHDLELALRLVSALPVYAEQRAHGEAFSWAERTVELAERAGFSSPLLCSAYGAAALSARFRGDIAQAIAHANDGLALAGGPDDQACALALYTLAEVALYEGRFEDVRSFISRLERLQAGGGRRALAVWVRNSQALTLAYQGAGPAAVAAAERLMATARQEHDQAAFAWGLYSLAEALMDSDPQRAIPPAEQALSSARALDERFLTGVALVTVASLNARHGDPWRAVPLFAETVDRWHRAGNWTQQWIAVRSIVGLLMRLGADEDAATLLAALTTRATAVEPWGADADRLAIAESTLVGRLPADRLAAARARGAALLDDEVVAWIREVLTGLEEGRQPGR